MLRQLKYLFNVLLGTVSGRKNGKSETVPYPKLRYESVPHEVGLVRDGKRSDDYSHVFRSKTRLDFVRMSTVMMGIEFVCSAETAFVTPILLGIGIDHRLLTMVWGISPFVGFFLAPLIGATSDRCRSRFGRRRPVMVLLGIGLAIGCLLVPYGERLGQLLGDRDAITADGCAASTDLQHCYRWAIAITIFGTVLLDFCAGAAQTPSIAYLLDVCLPDDHRRALSTFSVLAGIGGSAGYIMGAVDWSTTTLGTHLGGSINTVFTLVTMIFLTCLLVTVCSFREIPLPLIESDAFLMESITRVSKEKSTSANIAIDVDESKACPMDNGALHHGTMSATPNLFRNLFLLPPSIAILCLTNLFCWMSHLSYTLYFTDFVGEEVFGGDPAEQLDSNEYQLYIEGVRYGCFGMAIYSFACSVFSIWIEKLIQKLSARTVYCGGLAIDAVGMLCMATFPNKVTVYAFSVTGGIVSALLYTMPYILLAKYHDKGSWGHSSKLNPVKRGLATDISVLGGMLFVAQIILSLVVGPLVSSAGSTTPVMYTASASSLLAAICATQVEYMDL